MPIDVEQLRADIPATQNSIYLNVGWAGPRPKVVTEAMRKRLDYEALDGPGHGVAVVSSQELVEKAKTSLSRFLSVSAEELTFTQNTTEALNLVISGLSLESGDEVVLCDLEHPSVLIPCLYLQKRRGVVVKIVKIDPLASKEEILSSFGEAISGKTKLVCVSHIQYSCGLRMPVKELAQQARNRGAYLLVDGAQAVGHISVNLEELGCDFYAFPAHKWLLGPEGLGILYIQKDLIPRVEPLIVCEDSVSAFDFTGQFLANDRSMRKFAPSTQSWALHAGLLAAIEYIQPLGMAEIEAQIMGSATLLKRALPKIAGVSLLSHIEGELASGIISFAIKDMEPSEVATSLWHQGKIVGRWVNYPASARLCVGFYTNDRELNSTFGILRRLADSAQSEETLEQVRRLF